MVVVPHLFDLIMNAIAKTIISTMGDMEQDTDQVIGNRSYQDRVTLGRGREVLGMILTMSLGMLEEDLRVIQGTITPMASRAAGLSTEVYITVEVVGGITIITLTDIRDRLITHTEKTMAITIDSTIPLATMVGSQNTQCIVEDVEDTTGTPGTITSVAANVKGITLRSTKSITMMRVSRPVQDLVEGMAAAGEGDHEERMQDDLLASTITV